MTDPVRLGGFFSSFDTEAVISQLTDARMIKVDRLEVEKARAQVRSELMSTIAASLGNLLTSAGKLTRSNSALGKVAALSGSAFSASVTPSASLGKYSVDVLKLATGTRAGGTAISAALDTTAPMNQGNFSRAITAGTFTFSTASGGAQTLTIGDRAVDSLSVLDSANLETGATAGTFTIASETGGSFQVAVDPALESLDTVVAAINDASTLAGAGVTASITAGKNGELNQLTLTSTQGNITLGDDADTSNFLAAMNLAKGAANAETISSSSGITQMESLDDIVTRINASGVGITATVENDVNGRANLLRLTSSQGDIGLGNATDSSNFLSATRLLAAPGTTSRESTLSLARLSLAETMADAPFAGGPPAAGAHHFTVNGVQIDYDTAEDSLQDVVNRINSSDAGVVARYDAATDSLSLEQSATGSMAITLADDGAGGDFLAKTGLLAAAQTLGTNAEYTVDGGPTQYSATNEVAVATGVTLSLQAVTDGSPETVTINQNTDAIVQSIQGFVDAYNKAVAAVDGAVNIDPDDPSNSGELSGDYTVRALEGTLRGLISGAGVGLAGQFTNLNQIGIGFGEFGSKVGTTDTLKLNVEKLKSALDQDPLAVQNLLSTMELDATLVPGGDSSIVAISGNYDGNKPGRYDIVDDGAGTLVATFYADDGTAPTESVVYNALGGATLDDLIPGMHVTLAGILQAGNQSIRVSPSSISPLQQIQSFVEGQAGAGGILDRRSESYYAEVGDINDRIDRTLERIDREMDRLRAKFTAMELAMAKSDGILQSLQAATSQMATNRKA